MKRIILIMAILLPTIAAAQDLKPPIGDSENLCLDTHNSNLRKGSHEIKMGSLIR